jgi:hypothetical protein
VPDLTPSATRDITALKRSLGRRYHGWAQEETGQFRVDLERANGKWVACYGGTLDLALASARAVVREGARR